MQLSPYAKAIIAAALTFVGAIATTVQAAISDDVITSNEWAKIGIAAATFLATTGGVFAVPAKGYHAPGEQPPGGARGGPVRGGPVG